MQTMRKALFGSLLLMVVALPFTGQTDDWKRYRNTTGNFTALFPSDPQDTVNKANGGVESHTLLAKLPPAVYTVIYTTMSEEQKVDEATYTVFKNAVFQELPGCKAAAERQASPELAGFIGHWYRLYCDMNSNKVTILGNLYWGKHYAYAVMVMYQSSNAEPASTGKFLQSFAVL
jgi:hypothetical protein